MRVLNILLFPLLIVRPSLAEFPATMLVGCGREEPDHRQSRGLPNVSRESTEFHSASAPSKSSLHSLWQADKGKVRVSSLASLWFSL
ncbi:hypothetical protein DPMN_077167 [Dreissena polymorpha]|uniref:Secreted protein n=1 Tax=Dreissena polymorpha TaxID=45954 RepID=A0A9D3YKF4_DREPO|nr:hypothetical protein DPMN_077167 [Dreissena polymorpha]